MKKSKLFFKDSFKSFLKDILVVVLGIILLVVFIQFEQYAAAVFLGVMLIVVIIGALSFVIIDDENISLTRWGKISVVIPIDEIETVDTHAGNPDTLVIYAESDLIECAYEEKLFIYVLEKIGIEEKKCTELLTDGDNVTLESGKWILKRDNVELDALFGKKKYTHRRVSCYEKNDIFR